MQKKVYLVTVCSFNPEKAHDPSGSWDSIVAHIADSRRKAEFFCRTQTRERAFWSRHKWWLTVSEGTINSMVIPPYTTLSIYDWDGQKISSHGNPRRILDRNQNQPHPSGANLFCQTR